MATCFLHFNLTTGKIEGMTILSTDKIPIEQYPAMSLEHGLFCVDIDQPVVLAPHEWRVEKKNDNDPFLRECLPEEKATIRQSGNSQSSLHRR